MPLSKRWQPASTIDMVPFQAAPYENPVFRIRDILVPIRTRGSVPLTKDPALFISDLQDANQKNLFSKFFCLLLYFLKAHLKKLQKSRNQGFYYFCLIMEGSGSVPLTNDPDGPKTRTGFKASAMKEKELT
jgi:hypothetical protein